ncbi:hypothetical protein P9139_17515 [Curtobacterium flaccumfaciens]|nr:hypothetical protein P9139_17515 [Curtobacterium flaccumfaciens]
MPRDLVHRAARRLRRTLTGTPASPSAPSEPSVPPTPLPVLGYVVAGGGGAHPASAHVRVVRRVEHLARSGTATVQQVDPMAFVDGTDTTDYRAVLVQRDILPRDLVAPFLAAAAARGIRVAAEVDDDFFTAPGRDRLARAEYDPDRLASIDALVRGADLVLVSTTELADVVRPLARRVVVVRNALDPTIWTAGEALADDDLPADEHRVLYMGTLTHGADLELLRDVFTGLTASDGTPVRLEVIGVTEEADGEGPTWYRRVEVPDGHYPAFARWLVDHRQRWSAGVARSATRSSTVRRATSKRSSTPRSGSPRSCPTARRTATPGSTASPRCRTMSSRGVPRSGARSTRARRSRSPLGGCATNGRSASTGTPGGQPCSTRLVA